MKKFKFKINGNQYSTEIVSIDENIAHVEVNGTSYEVEFENIGKTSKTPTLVRKPAVPSTDIHPSIAKTSSPAAPKGAGTVKSPLPGVVLEVNVREGDVVKMGQKLLVLEAMKMENVIEADKEGKIMSIKAQKGDAVMEGDVLIIIG